MIVWAEGFDHYGTTPSEGRTNMLSGAWANMGTQFSVNSTQKRSGNYSLRATTAGESPFLARRVIGSARNVIGVAFGMYFTSLPATSKAWGFSYRSSANDPIICVVVNTDGSLAVIYGTSTVLIESDPVITANAWHHIETKLTLDNVVGAIEVRVDGAVIIALTNMNFGTIPVTQLGFGIHVSANGTVYYDDIVVWDDLGDNINDFIGPCRVETFLPTADTVAADWSINGAGSGYACINNIPPDGDTTFIGSTNVNDVSEFDLDTLPPETANIKGVYIPLMGKLIAAGVGAVQVSLVSNSEVSLGPEITLTTTYSYFGGVHELDPDTELPWTKEGLEAAILRVEKTI